MDEHKEQDEIEISESVRYAAAVIKYILGEVRDARPLTSITAEGIAALIAALDEANLI